MKKSLALLLATVVPTAAFIALDTAPYPGYFKYLLEFPLPFHSTKNLLESLQPQEGQKILELGAGTGRHAKNIALQLPPNTYLYATDIQQIYVKHMKKRFANTGLNIIVEQQNLLEMSYDTAFFDSIYTLTCTGEAYHFCKNEYLIKDISRVLKTGGRAIFAEFPDRHYIPLPTLITLCAQNDLLYKRHTGFSRIYVATFEKQ